MMRLENITKIYDNTSQSTTALKQISLHIAHHEFVSVLGPSGCGKTTCMNILGCLDTASSGDYYLDGIHTNQYSHNQLARIRNEKIGFVFQHFMLLPHLTALQNVALPLAYRQHAPAPSAPSPQDLLIEWGLKEHLHHYPHQLSGGQQQRTAIARAWVTQPDIILADEPTGALDSTNSQQLIELLSWINQTMGTTIVMITHNENLVKHTTRTLYLLDGEIRQPDLIHDQAIS